MLRTKQLLRNPAAKNNAIGSQFKLKKCMGIFLTIKHSTEVVINTHILAEISAPIMGFTGITLVLVSLAFLGSAAAHDCQNGTRPESQNDREGCDFYCWNDRTSSWDQFFFTDGVRCFYNNGENGVCKNGECHLTSDTGGPSNHDDDTPATTKKPKQKKKKAKKPKKSTGKSKKE